MKLKSDFPLFAKRPDLTYLDNAATSQKPQVVLDAITEFYTQHNSNIHRGPNFLAEEATIAYEDARKTVAKFIGAEHAHEIIFTRNATESINLVARTFGDSLQPGDEILLSRLEHHSNVVPWLQLKERAGITVRYLEVTPEGRIDFEPTRIGPKTKLVAITAMSNALGTITDLAPIIKAAHKAGAKVLVDACQSIVHSPLDVQKLDADFVVFSGHKIYGPMGIGVLYGKEEILKEMPPFLGGGDMINQVFMDRFTPADLPNKFEAGTPNVEGAVGLKAALDYVSKVGFKTIQKIESELTEKLIHDLLELPYIQVLGPVTMENRGPVVSFGMEGVHPHDIAEGLSKAGVCIRAGHHCAQVLMDHFGIPGTARISLALYNDEKDIKKAVKAIKEIYAYFH
jgi:cysteine desulfurase/selenocysteine lyase